MNVDAIVDEARAAFAAVADAAALENAKARFLGKAGALTELLKGLASCRPTRRRRAGAAINAAKQAIEAALDGAPRRRSRDAKLDAQLAAEALDVTLPGPRRGRGGLHPISRDDGAHRGDLRLDRLRRRRRPRDRDRLVQLHRAEQPGEPSGALDAGHVLRRRQGRRRHAAAAAHAHQPDAGALRAACTPPPIKVIAPGRTYRVDSDATHSPMFHQFEGLWIGEDVSFKDLKGVYTDFCAASSRRDDLELRFRPSFFPFTEPWPRSTWRSQRPAERPLARGLGLRPGAPDRRAQHRPGSRALHRLRLRLGSIA